MRPRFSKVWSIRQIPLWHGWPDFQKCSLRWLLSYFESLTLIVKFENVAFNVTVFFSCPKNKQTKMMPEKASKIMLKLFDEELLFLFSAMHL